MAVVRLLLQSGLFTRSFTTCYSVSNRLSSCSRLFSTRIRAQSCRHHSSNWRQQRPHFVRGSRPNLRVNHHSFRSPTQARSMKFARNRSIRVKPNWYHLRASRVLPSVSRQSLAFMHNDSQPNEPSKTPSQPSKPPTPMYGPVTQWLVRSLPPSMLPYFFLARMDKPIGTWLLLWPCLWSTALAAAPGHLPSLSIMSLFAAGAFIMRGAGCTINDLWDRDFDRKVTRTKTRPLASGQLSIPQGLIFLSAQLITGLGILLTFNTTTYVSVLPLFFFFFFSFFFQVDFFFFFFFFFGGGS